MKTGKLETPVNFLLGSDADGDIYYRASGVLARLAKGAANLKLFMNAAGTAPEWATGVKVGSFTRDLAAAAGNVSYTSVGFKPSSIEFIGSVTSNMLVSIGFTDATTGVCIFMYANTSAWGHTTSPILFHTGGAANTGTLVSLDADGFTLNWGTGITGTATIFYRALR